jgi:hypothetical protein
VSKVTEKATASISVLEWAHAITRDKKKQIFSNCTSTGMSRPNHEQEQWDIA